MTDAPTMPAAVFVREGVLELQERAVPHVSRPEDVLIEVEGCGICGTDLHILESPPAHPATPGSILGHEFIGRIVDRGSGAMSFGSGQRVAVAPNLSCGLCGSCRCGRPNHCTDFTTLGIFRDGGLAPLCVVPVGACYPLEETVPFEDAIWVEVLSCVVNSVDNINARAGESVVVIGGGPVGALHALLCLAGGARVLVSDVSDTRLDVLSTAGVSQIVNPRRQALGDAVQEWAPGGADVVVDCVGNQLDAALDAVRTGGRISLFGMNSNARPAVRQNMITRNELTIFGSYVGVNTFPRAISLLERRVIAPSVLLSAVLPLSGIHDALSLLRSGTAMKVVIRH